MKQNAATGRVSLTIGWESLAMMAICTADMIFTLLLVTAHKAVEANPLMAKCLESGAVTFCTVKMATVLALVGLAEWHRQKNPAFVSKALRMGVFAYTIIYICSVAAVNLR